MRILMLAWRDIKNPLKGGAEVLTHEIAKRWITEGHEVTIFCSAFEGYKEREIIDSIQIVRAGSRFGVYLQAYKYYKKEFKGNFDLIIDQINTVPFFTPLYVKEKRIVLIHQLAREVWFYESKFPMNIIGYMLEPLYLRLYNNSKFITVSESTKNDLLKLGVKSDNIKIMPEGINNKPRNQLAEKEKEPTFVYVGRVTKSKRVHDIIKAFGLVKNKIPKAQLKIIGGWKEAYKIQLDKLIIKNRIEGIYFLGFMSTEEKLEQMSKAHAILVASIREGWGLIVTEANSMGTPAIAYNVHGLKDSTQDNITGIVCKDNTPKAMAEQMCRLVEDETLRQKLSINALKWSREFSWDKAAEVSKKIIEEWYDGATVS